MLSKLLSVALLLTIPVCLKAQSPVFSPPNGSASTSSPSPQVFNGPLQAPDAVLKLPRTDVRSFGAVGNGTTDNCTALTNAANYALSVGAVLYFPPSASYFGTSCTVPFLGNWIVDGSGPMTLAGGTAASTALISTGTSITLNHAGIYGPGIINGNFLSPTIIWVEQGHHVNISVAGIYGMVANGKGVYFGDDAGVGAGGNEGQVYNTGFGFSSVTPAQSGSTCLYISGGNGTKGAFTDNDIAHNVLHGCTVGWVDHTGQNNRFIANHEWDFGMTVCGDEFAIGGELDSEYCDSPTLYGFHIRNIQTRIIGGVAFLGPNGTDNVATAIQFDIPAEPFAYISGMRIYGNDVTHRWLADTNLGFNATNTTWCDVRDEANVTTRQNGTGTCIRNGNQKYFGSLWLNSGGMFVAIAANFTCSAVCNFVTGSNWQKATLSQNATSTWSISTPGGNVPYGNFTIMICQPATGGPFTFTPPANSVGFGTIGNTAGKCNLQDFVWDGTTLRASSTMQINE